MNLLALWARPPLFSTRVRLYLTVNHEVARLTTIVVICDTRGRYDHNIHWGEQ
jgi:hypothetical protein